MKRLIGALIAGSLAALPALAERRVNFELVNTEGVNVRYTQGVATYDLRREHGAVQITPLGLDHGRLTFGVAVLNLGQQADHFGVEDIAATINGQTTAVLTRDRLDRMARNRALWTQIAVAVVAGAAAGMAASSTDTYSATTYTPRGTYRTVMTGPSAAGQVAAAASVAGGAYTIANIQGQLDATRAALADEIVQTTTIDPEDSYAGRFVVEKLRGSANRLPQDVSLVLTFNGEPYSFTFRVTQAR